MSSSAFSRSSSLTIVRSLSIIASSFGSFSRSALEVLRESKWL